jgi:hypothetical protein
MILFAFGLSTTLTTNALELLLPMHIQSETARNIAWDLELHLSLQAKKGGTTSRRVSGRLKKVNQLVGLRSRSCFTYRTKLISRCLMLACP